MQRHRTPDQIVKSWLLLDRNKVQFDRARNPTAAQRWLGRLVRASF